jgi:photosystem II stability/assembly factor-like uncharacterized protein
LFSLITTAHAAAQEQPEAGLNETTLEGLAWRSTGPALMAGRIADIVFHPEDRSTWYVGVGSGGVWKTVNRGITWTPIFDDQGSYSIGCLAIDPNNPNTLWVGTGENVSGRHVGYGDGVYKSLDGGQSWTNMGLANSEHIGMIRIDPRDSNVVYVAAQGPLWSPGGDRGLYKTTDGGQTWELILSGNEYTGVNEVHLDPRNPDVLLASTHQLFRNVAALMDGGPGSGIHKSIDGGQTWRELTRGIPQEHKGKIGLSISPANPDVVYATIELAQRTGGLWRSLDGGESWEKRSDEFYSGTGPHYYQEVFASPHDVDTVYQVAPTLHRSTDGGATMEPVRNPHVHGDYHAMVFDPADPDYLMVGTDGGVYETFDGLENWRFFANMPITQFYKVAVDYDEPFYNIYGGTQDNNTQGGPSRTDNVHGIRNSDWFITLFGDGHQPAVDPTNPDVVYSEWQEGNLVRFDRATGEIIYIQPQPAAGEPTERFNWDSPILLSPHDPARLYFASQRVWRSDDRGDSWQPVSGDLTHARDRLTLPMMGRVWSYDSGWDLMAMSQYGTITSLSESPVVEGLLYAGTDDGRIQVSENGGESWRAIDRLPDVPEGFFVNDIKADLHDPDTVYVVVDDHKSGDFAPYVLRSTNRGRSWKSISESLPERHVVWRIVQDHVKPELLFVGTEFGVFFSVDSGRQWTKLAGGVPNIPFRDLAIQQRENDLVGATFGRSFYVLDDYTPLREVTADKLAAETLLFPVRDALWYIPRMPLGEMRMGSKASQGDAFFIAPNPPFGAVITYYLPEPLQTRKQQRREREKPIEEQGGDTPYPGWDALYAERTEDEPGVVLTIRDAAGAIVRKLEGPTEAGFHRVAWDLRYPSPEPWTAKPEEQWLEFPGPLAAPGQYRVSLATRLNGELRDTGLESTINVKVMRQNSLATAGPEAVVQFGLRYDAAVRAAAGADAALEAGLVEIGAVKQTLLRSGADQALRERARALEVEMLDLQRRLNGDEKIALAGAQGPVSVAQRLGTVQIGTALSTYGPNPSHRRSLEIAEQDFAEIKSAMDRLFDEALPALRQALDDAGVPWTPGRGVPARD